MNKLKKGDLVARISYNKDVIFEITDIIKSNNNDDNNNDNKICILKGITQRIEADSPLEDLTLMDKRAVKKEIKSIENKILDRISKYLTYENNSEKNNLFHTLNIEKRSEKAWHTGKILHLDGDRRYSEKSARYYKSLGLNAIVKNVAENKQAKVVTNLLDRYNPDILVITGHDGMIKKETNFNDIYNYRNSRYFINTVNVARNWNGKKGKQLAIFAGACQSFYEAIMLAGANFASSPKRIMIDFIDPLIVAERIATTDNTKYIGIKDIESELRDGREGIDGIGTMGKKTYFSSL